VDGKTVEIGFFQRSRLLGLTERLPLSYFEGTEIGVRPGQIAIQREFITKIKKGYANGRRG
jgi:hypothetical protein